ncbi:MAG: histidine phosphatase family protein [Desulfobacterales bacterium]|nr:histidine phosphatase family protein [Desulfobacterales bacterium]
MTTPTIIYLVRHGNVHNPDRILYGRLPRFRLSQSGLEEARAAGRFLNGAPIAALYCSPLLRARQTAREIRGFHPDITLRQSSHLLEVLNPFEGRPSGEVDARNGDVYSGVGPPYEQPQDIVVRVLKFFQLARLRHAGENVVAVTHGDVIVFAMLWARGMALTPRNKSGLHALGFTGGYPATGSLTAFIFRTDSSRELPEVRYFKPGRLSSVG